MRAASLLFCLLLVLVVTSSCSTKSPENMVVHSVKKEEVSSDLTRYQWDISIPKMSDMKLSYGVNSGENRVSIMNLRAGSRYKVSCLLQKVSAASLVADPLRTMTDAQKSRVEKSVKTSQVNLEVLEIRVEESGTTVSMKVLVDPQRFQVETSALRKGLPTTGHMSGAPPFEATSDPVTFLTLQRLFSDGETVKHTEPVAGGGKVEIYERDVVPLTVELTDLH